MPILNKNDEYLVKKYDEFVRNSPYRSLTQDRRWAEVKSNWGSEHVYLEREGQIIAAMSILIKSLPGGFTMLYAPRGPVCDVKDMNLVQDLLQEVEPLAKKHRAIMLKFDPEIPYSDELYTAYKFAGFNLISKDDDQDKLIQPRLNMVLSIKDHDAESIMSRFSKKCRSDIRRGMKRGVEVRYSREDEDIELFYESYKTMSIRNNITIRPLEYFKQIRDSFDQARFYIASHEDDVLAAALTINYNGKVYYLYAGSTEHKRNLNGSYVLNYEMIKWGMEEDGEQYDFGGVLELSDSDGLYNFKKKFCDKDGHTEYIGEIDKVYKPFMYTLLEKVIPVVRKLRKKRTNND